MKGCTETNQKRVTEGWGGVSEYGVLGGMGLMELVSCTPGMGWEGVVEFKGNLKVRELQLSHANPTQP